MKFRVTFEFDSSREAVAFLQGIDGSAAVEAEREEPTVTISSTEPVRKIKSDPVVTRMYAKTPAKRKATQKATETGAESGGSHTAEEASTAGQATTLKDETPVSEADTQAVAAKALNDLYAKQGLEVSKDVLARHGVKRFGDLKPEQYTDFVAMCKAAMESGKV